MYFTCFLTAEIEENLRSSWSRPAEEEESRESGGERVRQQCGRSSGLRRLRRRHRRGLRHHDLLPYWRQRMHLLRSYLTEAEKRRSSRSSRQMQRLPNDRSVFYLYVCWSTYRLWSTSRGKSLLELWVTTFLPDWQPPLIIVRFISNFLCMCSNSIG